MSASPQVRSILLAIPATAPHRRGVSFLPGFCNIGYQQQNERLAQRLAT